MNTVDETSLVFKADVWKILMEECGAPDDPDLFHGFSTQWPECQEWRFMGDLGFGGKIYSGRSDLGSRRNPPYVGTYREDETIPIRAMIDAANKRLAELVQ